MGRGGPCNPQEREPISQLFSPQSSGNLALHSPAAAAKRFHIRQKDGFVVPLNSDGKITHFFSCYLFFFLVLFESEGTVFEASLPISFSKAALSAHHITSEQMMGGGLWWRGEAVNQGRVWEVSELCPT